MLVVYGYLKPDIFKKQINTEITFMKFYHIIYLFIATSLIVNFLITIINEISSKGTPIDQDKSCKN